MENITTLEQTKTVRSNYFFCSQHCGNLLVYIYILGYIYTLYTVIFKTKNALDKGVLWYHVITTIFSPPQRLDSTAAKIEQKKKKKSKLLNPKVLLIKVFVPFNIGNGALQRDGKVDME